MMLDRVQAAVALRALMGCTHGGEPISPEFHAFVVGILGNSSPSPSDVDMFNVTPPGDMESLREFAVLLRDIADAIWPRKKDKGKTLDETALAACVAWDNMSRLDNGPFRIELRNSMEELSAFFVEEIVRETLPGRAEDLMKAATKILDSGNLAHQHMAALKEAVDRIKDTLGCF